MESVDLELKQSVQHAKRQRPRDSATLIIVRQDGPNPRVMMGRRHERHSFMPGKFVFPGGRLDAADVRLKPGRDLDRLVLEKLLLKMRGRRSEMRARGLALAAVRETFEEVGLILGTPHESLGKPPRDTAWAEFFASGYAPDLSGLRFFARAITPPGRTRRFDSRFFVVDARHVANLDRPAKASTDELLDAYWVTFAEARELDLPSITRKVLDRLEAALQSPAGLAPSLPVPFQYMRGKQWREEML